MPCSMYIPRTWFLQSVRGYASAAKRGPSRLGKAIDLDHVRFPNKPLLESMNVKEFPGISS
jgi:hypothetical protein